MVGPKLSRDELCSAANELLATTGNGEAGDPIHPRTIRYWTDQGLLPRRGGPNLAARYEQSFVNRCAFIRRLQLTESLTLAQIRQVLHEVDNETVRRVAEGIEPLDIASSASEGELIERDNRGEKVISIASAHDAQRRGRAPRGVDDDRPRLLQTLSDLSKARAIEGALHSLGVEPVATEIRGVTYRDSLIGRGEFRSPARIDAVIKLRSGDSDNSNSVDVREVPDTDLCYRIAESLASRTGERYVVDLASKRYENGQRDPDTTELRLIVLVARELE